MVERGAGAAGFDKVQQIADLAFLRRDDALEHRALRTCSARDQHLFIDGRSSRDDVRLLGQLD